MNNWGRLFLVAQALFQRQKHQRFVAQTQRAQRFGKLVTNIVGGRKMFQTKLGYLGIGPERIEPDDRVVIFRGAKTPFIIWARDRVTKSYYLVGECYVLGLMDGEGLEMGFSEEIRLE